MEQFKQFDLDKQAAIGALQELRDALAALGKLGVDTEADMRKIEDALTGIEADVLRIALLGAFSDGKTSVIAGWLGRVMSDMKIDMDESSDRLAIYHPEGLPGKCEIVDTPGLFGDKEKTVAGTQVMYQDITKRYISEAHLILYVVDATNPLKDSHGDIAKWLLRDLNKLSSTLFVINKMDEVSDLTDQAMFDDQAAIKKEALKSKLKRVANLTAEEEARLNLVCMSADPNGRGLEFWFGKPEHYESRSRINTLKESTSRILQSNVAEVLIAKTGLDVVRDLVQQKLRAVHAQLEAMDVFETQAAQERERIEQDIRAGRREVKQLSAELFRELQAMEARLMGKLRPLSLEGIRPFLEDEIGYTADGAGYKLHLLIKTTVDRFFEQSSAVVNRISLDISRQLDSSESFAEALGQKAASSMGNVLKSVSTISPAAIKATIVMARDVLKQVTGIAIKFKPWEATKLAGAVSKWAGPAGAVFSLGSDIYGMYKSHELEQQLAESREQIGNLIKDAFKDIYLLLADDEKMFAFFAPQLNQFETVLETMDERAASVRSNRTAVIEVQRRLDRITLTR
ncbi:GTP-binding protein [Duganella sp. FT50W]|uniref:GTP-binding protein n=1 Tax=Duganella lactea TaxID=2692173 RepID=A0A6L8MK88_9BURK|nr:LeoA/HP0731 family dynamin-like GTPase [Duganella lactea]MYM80835.1 GTP-binding protein [Duganella lactea]